MPVAELDAQISAKAPEYWGDFADLTAKDEAEVIRFRASDGYNLTVYEFGKGNPDGVIIVNALVSPFLLSLRLASELSQRYRVIAWENRGAPCMREDSPPPDISLGRHARDLIEIAAHKKLTGFHTVSLCSGAPVIARAASLAELPMRSVSLYAPSGAAAGDVTTPYQDSFTPLIKQAGTGDSPEARRTARVLQDYIHARRAASRTMGGEVGRVTSVNFRELESVTRFARLMTDYWSLDMSERHAEFDIMARRHPVMVMHALDDDVVDYTASLNACLRTRLPKLVLYPTGGHFKLSEPEPDARRDVAAFMAAHDTPPARPAGAS